MNKIFVSLFICASLGVNIVSANSLVKTTEFKNTKLSQADMQTLFASSNVNAVVLSEEEMKNTTGEADPITIGIAVGAGMATYQALNKIFKKWF